MRAGGVNIDSGVLYLAAIDSQGPGLGVPVAIVQPKLIPHPDLTGAEALQDLTERVRQELEAPGVKAVGLVETRGFYGLQYKHVYPRVVGMCAVMAACTTLGVTYETLKTEKIGRRVGRPASELKTVDPNAFGFTKSPTYWTTGLAEAYAAAAAMLAEIQQ